jgi:lysophospholipid hydrolase
MVLGMGDDPILGEYERLLLSMKTTARKELIILHPDRSVLPGSTREWLKVGHVVGYTDFFLAADTVADETIHSSAHSCRTSGAIARICIKICAHISAQGLVVRETKPATSLPDDVAAVAALKNLKDRVQTGIQKYRGIHSDARPQRPAHSNDFARLARRICGKSVGLVLGGGGARGISHLVCITL